MEQKGQPEINNKPSFRVYIDESGDEGFVFKGDGSGSSRWFILTAVVIRASKDGEMIKSLRASREALRKPPTYHLHFQKLCHEARCAYVEHLARLPIKTASILVHKPSLPNPAYFKGHGHRLYRYCTRLLMERVSRICEDNAVVGGGNGTADIIFSNRGRMSYDEITAYLQGVIADGDKPSVKMMINPKIILSSQISAVPASALAGLQVADALASSCYFAASLNYYQRVEPAYLKALAKTFFRFENGLVWGRGIKFYPDLLVIKKHAPEVSHLEACF
jgi:hypothetical protein